MDGDKGDKRVLKRLFRKLWKRAGGEEACPLRRISHKPHFSIFEDENEDEDDEVRWIRLKSLLENGLYRWPQT